MPSSFATFRAVSRAGVMAVLLGVTAAFVLGGAPAAARDADIVTLDELRTAVSPGTETTLTLAASMGNAATETLTIDRDLTLDLANHDLFLSRLTISSGATVTLIAGTGNRASFLQVDGTLVLGADMRMNGGASGAVGASGRISDDGTTRTVSGSSISIANGGTITADMAPGVTVAGNNYNIRLASNLPADGYEDVTVYAPTFSDAGLAFPDFTRTNTTITSWNAASDGSGAAFTATTPLAELGEAWLFYAQWAPDGITSIQVTYRGAPSPARAGSIPLLATDATPGGDAADITDLVTFTSDHPDDVVAEAGFDSSLGAYAAGPRLVTGTLRGGHVAADTDLLVVADDSVGSIDFSMQPTTVTVGGTSAAHISAWDSYDNPFGGNLFDLADSPDCGWCRIEMASSDDSDVIDPDTGVIRFTTVGSRTITATVWRGEGSPLVATAVVTVVAAEVPAVPPSSPSQPTPAALAESGIAPSAMPWAGAAMLLCGVGALLVAGRRSRA